MGSSMELNTRMDSVCEWNYGETSIAAAFATRHTTAITNKSKSNISATLEDAIYIHLSKYLYRGVTKHSRHTDSVSERVSCLGRDRG